MSVPAGWEGILDPDERILWQGRPMDQLTWDDIGPAQGLMGLFFIGFSSFWMFMAAQGGGFFWMFGLIFLAVGFVNSVGRPFLLSYLRRHTHYTLTSKRAFVATDPFGRRGLKSYPITPDMPLEFTGGSPGTIRFGVVRQNEMALTTLRPVFERLPDGRDVLDLVHQVQERRT